MKALTLILLLCSALFFIGCSKSDNDNTANANNSNNSNAKPAASKAPETGKTETTASGDKFGVAACDEYFVKMEKCMNSPNVPEAVKSSYKQNMETSRKAWQQAASTPQGKAGLESSCQTALKAAEQFFATCK